MHYFFALNHTLQRVRRRELFVDQLKTSHGRSVFGLQPQFNCCSFVRVAIARHYWIGHDIMRDRARKSTRYFCLSFLERYF